MLTFYSPSLFLSPVFLLPSPLLSPPLSLSYVPLPLFFLSCLFTPLPFSHTSSSLSLLSYPLLPPGTKDFGTAVGMGGSADVTLVATQVETEGRTDPSSLLVLDKAYRVTITARGGTVLCYIKASNLVVTIVHTFLENMKLRFRPNPGFMLQT